MSAAYKLIPTTSTVYGAIYCEHAADLTVFATISHADGNPNGDRGQGRMYTEWGFKTSDFPTIAYDETWRIDVDNPGVRHDCERKYYLCVARSRD
jgi:hypothetical protein